MLYKNKTGKRIKWKVKSIATAMVLLTCTFYFSTAIGQESIKTTVSNATGSEGSASYSIGQVVYQTHTGTNGSVAEGIQQPYEI
jgi:hypothetical protein